LLVKSYYKILKNVGFVLVTIHKILLYSWIFQTQPQLTKLNVIVTTNKLVEFLKIQQEFSTQLSMPMSIHDV